jgi:hypothetical protein
LSRIGASESRAHEIALSGLEGSYYVGNIAKPFLALPPAGRVAVVNDLVGWVKTYYASAAFKAAWTKEREQNKPELDAAGGTIDEAVRAKQAEEQKGVDDARRMIAMVPADQRAQLETSLKQQEATLKSPQHVAAIRQQIIEERGASAKSHDEAMKHWQDDYPADYNVLLGRRLHAFLTTSSTVNFDAKVVTRDGARVFEDPQFEEKPSEWKMCYRAGREATQAARAAATQWLKEIGK